MELAWDGASQLCQVVAEGFRLTRLSALPGCGSVAHTSSKQHRIGFFEARGACDFPGPKLVNCGARGGAMRQAVRFHFGRGSVPTPTAKPGKGSAGSPWLSVRRLPARLHAGETALLLGFQPHDIPILVKARLLKPLGGGPRNCVKFFAAVEIREHSRDTKWLDRATKAISRGNIANQKPNVNERNS